MLSTEQILEAFRNNWKISVPIFAAQEVQLFFEDEEDLRQGLPALTNFLALTESDRELITPHLHAYFRDIVDDVGFDWVEPGMKNLPAGSESIWNFVYPVSVTTMLSWAPFDQNSLQDYVVIEANCGWEEEHGLLISWLDGNVLIKVSDYDGHATNGHAYGDLSRDKFVYCSSVNKDYWTRSVTNRHDHWLDALSKKIFGKRET